MKVVIALGGNAIARRGESLEAGAQQARVRDAVSALADVARSNDVVVTHGNGPQVGLLAMQGRAYKGVEPYPLDVLGAETEGMIGYLLERELASVFPGSDVATLLTQVEVDPDDPAFEAPSKPIGPPFEEGEARRLEARLRWRFRAHEGSDGSKGWRRVVPSPEPTRIRELRTIQILVDAGVLVICAGGGGIPVVETRDAGFRGVEAVIDKDATAALLAKELRADRLLLLTDVPGVYEDWPDRKKLLRTASVETLRALALEAGSMAPKVEAACRFAEAGGQAAIGDLAAARRVFSGEAGTQVRSAGTPTEYAS